MNELHLFSGAGGGILGGMLLGHTPVCAVEIEPYPRKVLLQRQRDGHLPKFPIWDDICTFDGKPWKGKVDIVCGGFPCQDISAANTSAKGIGGERSGLWGEMRRVVSEVRPKYVFVENSPMLVSKGLALVIGELAEMGYASRWCVIGGNQSEGYCKRDRAWLLASSNEIGQSGVGPTNRSDVREGQIHTNECDNGNDVWSGSKECVSFDDWQSLLAPMCLGDGLEVANRVDRIAAVGNGQDPRVARLAWQILAEGL